MVQTNQVLRSGRKRVGSLEDLEQHMKMGRGPKETLELIAPQIPLRQTVIGKLMNHYLCFQIGKLQGMRQKENILKKHMRKFIKSFLRLSRLPS